MMTTPWGVVPKGTVLSPEWAWVLQHADIVEKYTWRVVERTPIELEEGRSALILDLALNFHKFDPERGKATTFIWMRAKYVRRTLVRQGLRTKTRGPSVMPLDKTSIESPGSTSKIGARAEVSLAFKNANPVTKKALISIARDWNAKQVRKHLNCTLTKRDELVRSLGEQP